MRPSAKIIADSISEQGHRVTTMEVTFHRFVLAEMNTHRVFSRNSASSRARPFSKVVQEMEDDPAIPLVWGSEQRGMQGGQEIEDTESAIDTWIDAKNDALFHARILSNTGVHKGLVNRLIEPFISHTAVITATDWSGFFEQRCSPLAQPEIRVAAEMMRDALEASEPQTVPEGYWHTPYISDSDISLINNKADLVKISAARCARVSYLTHDGKRDLGKDLELYDRLVSAQPAHFSPLEHAATPWADNVAVRIDEFTSVDDEPLTIRREVPRFGNLLGWRQLRLEVEAAQG